MPDEPNRNLDQQLTAWARKRRDEAGAPFELHSATRKLLQDEVARTFPKKSDEAAPEPAGWLKIFWPRFVLAGSLCLAMVILAGILLPGLGRSRSKAQQIALVRQQEKSLSADSSQRNAPAQIAPKSIGSRPIEAPALSRRAEAGKSSLAEAQPPAAPSLAENKPLEQEVRAQSELKDTRLKTEQSVNVAERSFSENGRKLVLSDKAKEATPAGTTAPARDLYAQNESNQILLRQRYAPGQAQAGSLTSATNALANAEKVHTAAQTPAAQAPQVALNSANVAQPVGAVGWRGGGTASNSAPGVNLAFNRPQNRAKADDNSLALTQQNRPASGGIVSLAEQREIDRLGTGTAYSYYAAVPSSSAPQRFAQVREYRVNFNSPPMPNVLSSFQLAQNGRQIRVVDADGSIYDGAIEQPPTEETARRGIPPQTTATELTKTLEPELKRRVAAATANEALVLQNAFFRVAGTNVTLKQLVVFEGNFLAASNQANEIVVGARRSTDQSAAAAGRRSLSQKAQQTASGLIRGQATIGSSNRIEINAAPVPE